MSNEFMTVIKEILKTLKPSTPETVSRVRTNLKNGNGVATLVKPEAPRVISKEEISALQKLADSIGLEIKKLLLKFGAINPTPNANTESSVEEPLTSATGESYIKATKALLNHNLSRLLLLIESSGAVPPKNVESLRTEYQNLINFDPRSQNEVEMFVKQLNSFFSQLVSSVENLTHRDMTSVKLIMEDIFKLFASPPLVKSSLGEMNLASMINSGVNQTMEKPAFDIAYLKVLSGIPTPEADYLPALSKDLGVVANFISKNGALPNPALQKVIELLGNGFAEPLNRNELRKYVKSIGFDLENKIFNSINKTPSYLETKFSPVRRIIFNNLSANLISISADRQTAENYKIFQNGAKLYRSLFESNRPAEKGLLLAPGTSSMELLYKVRMSQSLLHRGVSPTSRNLLAAEALLENNISITRKAVDSLFRAISSLDSDIGSQAELKHLMKTTILLKQLKLPLSPENIRFITDIKNVQSSISGDLNRLYTELPNGKLSGSKSLNKFHNLSLKISGTHKNTKGELRSLVEFAKMAGIEVPESSSGKLGRLLSKSKHSSFKELTGSINSAIDSALQSVKSGKSIALEINKIRILGQLAASLGANSNNSVAPTNANLESLLKETGIVKTDFEMKIVSRLAAANADISRATVLKISNYLLNTLKLSPDSVSSELIDRAVKAAKLELPLNKNSWKSLESMDPLSPEKSTLISNYLMAMNKQSPEGQNDNGLKQILELLFSLSKGSADKATFKMGRSLFEMPFQNHTLRKRSNLSSKLNKIFNGSVKGTLLRTLRYVKLQQNKVAPQQQNSILKSIMGALEQIEQLQSNITQKGEELLFSFPFPDTPHDGHASLRFSKKELDDGSEELNLSIKLAPEPLGPVSIYIQKNSSAFNLTVDLERGEYMNLLRKNLPQLIQRFENMGLGVPHISCTSKPKQSISVENLNRLYA
ncbi:MAG: flagellar hook-length control protein FliK [Candidatus Marinimicrobia bacterium]|nr:flagellar hook-length control protein FliK [Candidatus Neomarinimicrobiota bacterium]